MSSYEKPASAQPTVGRRQLLTGLAASSLLLSDFQASFGQGRIIRPVLVTSAPTPIAIPNFVAGSPADSEYGAGIAQIITDDLKRSGVFAPIDQSAFIERTVDIDKAPQFASWKQIDALALVVGRVTSQSDRRLKIEFRLWDITSGQQLMGQQYVASPDDWRRIAHMISDQIHERLA